MSEYPKFIVTNYEGIFDDKPNIICVGYLKKSENGTKHQSNIIYGGGGISPCLSGMDMAKSMIGVCIPKEKE